MRLLRQNVLAMVALFVALGGAAYAGSTIGANDIANDAVRSKHIKAGEVKPSDGDVVRFARAANEVVKGTSTSGALGPSIAVEARTGDLLHVNVAATMRLAGSLTNSCSIKLRVQGPPGDFDRTVITSTPADPVTIYMDGDRTPGQEGTTNLAAISGHDIPIPQSGNYTISLTHDTGSGDPCGYSNRRIWVEHSR